MSVPTVSWSESTPAGSDNINAGDNKIRELKTQIREVIDVDHKFDSSGQDADMGKHDQVSLLEKADIGTGAEGKPILGAQTVSGKAELVFTDEDDNDVQVTSGGKLGAATTNILGNDADFDGTLTSDDITIDTNNTYIKSKDAAGTGTVDLIKADASDVVVVPDGTQTATDAAPSNDKDIANKKYVDDNRAAFGSWASKTVGTTYQAATDGFVVAYVSVSDNNQGSITGYTDSSATPTTVRGGASAAMCDGCAGGGGAGTRAPINGFCMPVKSGDYYKVASSTYGGSPTYTMFWIPRS